MRISVIIPVLNGEDCIQRAIHHALAAGAQVEGEWEIVVVDNGSSDGTTALLNKAVQSYPEKVRWLTCRRPGAAAARNHGASATSGEWLQFLDADDSIAPDKLGWQLALAGDADWVVGAYRHLFADGSTEDSMPAPGLWEGLFHQFRTGCTHSNLIRRSAFEQVGGWNEGLPSNQDPDLHFRLLKAGIPYVIDPVVRSFYHHHSGPRITTDHPAGSLQRRITMLADANTYLHTNQPAYWRAHAPYFRGALLRSVRMLATYDLQAASTAYRAHFFDSAYGNLGRPFDLVPRYTRLYPALGFRNLERLRLALAGVLPPAIKQRLKAE